MSNVCNNFSLEIKSYTSCQTFKHRFVSTYSVKPIALCPISTHLVTTGTVPSIQLCWCAPYECFKLLLLEPWLMALVFLCYCFFTYFLKLDLHSERPMCWLPQHLSWWSEVAVVLIHRHKITPSHSLKFFGQKLTGIWRFSIPSHVVCL